MVLIKIAQQLHGHCTCKRAIRHLGVIPRTAQDAHFVLHLHHHHCVVVRVCFAQMLHQRRKRVLVRSLGLGAESAQDIHGTAVLDYAWKALRILLHPHRLITGHSVLPRSQP